MKNFKFFSNNTLIDYDGEFSQQAVRLVQEYVSGRFTSRRVLETPSATYTITETTYQHGDMAAAVVDVFPTFSNARIKFYITVGNVISFITGHIVEYNTNNNP